MDGVMDWLAVHIWIPKIMMVVVFAGFGVLLSFLPWWAAAGSMAYFGWKQLQRIEREHS